MVYTASSRWLIVNLGTISHTLLNLLFNIGKSFTVKATKNKQINKKLATISLTKKYRSKKNQTLLLSCLMIHSTRPQWPFLAIFAQKNMCCSHQKPWATPWFHEKTHKIRLYICVPKVTRKKPKPPLKNDETEPKKFRRPRYIQSIVVLSTHYILINFALILNQKIK